jgi:hypothetical protein
VWYYISWYYIPDDIIQFDGNIWYCIKRYKQTSCFLALIPFHWAIDISRTKIVSLLWSLKRRNYTWLYLVNFGLPVYCVKIYWNLLISWLISGNFSNDNLQPSACICPMSWLFYLKHAQLYSSHYMSSPFLLCLSCVQSLVLVMCSVWARLMIPKLAPIFQLEAHCE